MAIVRLMRKSLSVLGAATPGIIMLPTTNIAAETLTASGVNQTMTLIGPATREEMLSEIWMIAVDGGAVWALAGFNNPVINLVTHQKDVELLPPGIYMRAPRVLSEQWAFANVT